MVRILSTAYARSARLIQSFSSAARYQGHCQDGQRVNAQVQNQQTLCRRNAKDYDVLVYPFRKLTLPTTLLRDRKMRQCPRASFRLPFASNRRRKPRTRVRGSLTVL